MKKLLYISILLFGLYGCNPDGCFKKTGDIISKEVSLPLFDRILVGNEISLVLKQGSQQKVTVQTGKNLIDEIEVTVIDGRLLLEDANSCNFTRNYAVTTIYVTAPNIIEIRSNTARKISSNGILTYPNLKIYAEDYHEETLTNGVFDLEVACQNLEILSNGAAIFKFSGSTNALNIFFASGDARFSGENLISNTITINQKSTNDILVYPLNSITGSIYSIGNVVSFNHPANVNITEYYSGKLIYN